MDNHHEPVRDDATTAATASGAGAGASPSQDPTLADAELHTERGSAEPGTASGVRASVLRAAVALAGAVAPLAALTGGLAFSRWLRTEDEMSTTTLVLYGVLLGVFPPLAAGVFSAAFGAAVRRVNALRLVAVSLALGMTASYLVGWGSEHLETLSLVAAGVAAIGALGGLVAAVGLSTTPLAGRRVRLAGAVWTGLSVVALVAPLAAVVRDAAPRAVLPVPSSAAPEFAVDENLPVRIVLTAHKGSSASAVELIGTPIPGGYAISGEGIGDGVKWRPGKPVPVIADLLPELTGLGGMTPWAMVAALGEGWEAAPDATAARSQVRLEQLILAEQVPASEWDSLAFRERQHAWRVLRSTIPAIPDVKYGVAVADGVLVRLSVVSPHAKDGDFTELVVTFGS